MIFGRYQPAELTILVVAYLMFAIGIVLTFVGSATIGWILVVISLLVVLPISLRVKRRQDAAKTKPNETA